MLMAAGLKMFKQQRIFNVTFIKKKIKYGDEKNCSFHFGW